ncbi:hypothetical protein O6H91_06G040000 [Diphasiastrum complanatum]|uniref:Uncharacterized protein n=1 Tax=Diphasiastrum complanatum TaxID=34168 RepID=A0ACC2DCT9_DIPCM|nr:hypothetical protein O6H91_06G040000 [Diphasiastrum complanatum]
MIIDGWARENPVHDVDDTCMGFRLLRLHGYDVSPKCIEHFRSDGKFYCFAGESQHGVTEILNLYRASQVRFPGETILEESHAYSKTHLANALQNKDAFDKWAFKKDLEGEVEYALKYPWHRSVPRLEARNYIEQYGPKDLWLGKTMYRACITVILDDLFDSYGSVSDLKLFLEAVKRWDPSVISELSEETRVSFNGLYNTLNSSVEDAFKVQGRDIRRYLRTIAETERGELASSISCYMNENPNVSEEEAKAHVYGIIDHASKELNRELVRPNNAWI